MRWSVAAKPWISVYFRGIGAGFGKQVVAGRGSQRLNIRGEIVDVGEKRVLDVRACGI